MAVAALLATACASDGRELDAARDWQTTTTRPAPPTSAPPFAESESGVTLASPDFEPGDLTPVELTCAGQNRAPELTWSTIGDDVAELAISLSDQTDPEEPLLLWLVAGLDPASTGIVGSRLPPEAVVTLNDFGQSDWGNPCLETLSSGRRDLQFRLYLLPTASGLEPGAAGNEAWDHISALATDTATVLMQIDGQP